MAGGATAGSDPFPRYMSLAAGAGVVGLLGAYLAPGSPEGRQSALLGVGASVLAGALALALKRRAAARGLNWALGMMGVAFAVRMVLVGVGLAYVIRAELGPLPFTVGFFGVYLVLQWVEISYVLAEAKRRGGGGPE